MPRYASSIDLARLAGVSQSSVSRTYRPGASVSAKTRLAGFDDIAMAGWAAYDLTTFVQEARLMVSETIRVLQTAEDARASLRGPSGSAGSTDRARVPPAGATPLRRAQRRCSVKDHNPRLAIALQPPREEGIRPKRKFFPLSAPGPSRLVTLPVRLGRSAEIA
jgi:hypothetical protein